MDFCVVWHGYYELPRISALFGTIASSSYGVLREFGTITCDYYGVLRPRMQNMSHGAIEYERRRMRGVDYHSILRAPSHA